MKSRTRPSIGCALRAAGNEIMKRSGPCGCARVTSAAPAARPRDRMTAASTRDRIEPLLQRRTDRRFACGRRDARALIAGLAATFRAERFLAVDRRAGGLTAMTPCHATVIA